MYLHPKFVISESLFRCSLTQVHWKIHLIKSVGRPWGKDGIHDELCFIEQFLEPWRFWTQEKKKQNIKKKKHQLTLMVTSAIQPVPMHLISNLPFKSQLTRFKAVVNFSWPPKEERFHPKTVQLRLRSYQKYLKKENRKGLKCEGDSHVFPYNFNVTNVGNY